MYRISIYSKFNRLIVINQDTTMTNQNVTDAIDMEYGSDLDWVFGTESSDEEISTPGRTIKYAFSHYSRLTSNLRYIFYLSFDVNVITSFNFLLNVIDRCDTFKGICRLIRKNSLRR